MARAIVIGVLVGALLGQVVLRGPGAWLGAIVGGIIGAIVGGAMSSRRKAPKAPAHAADPSAEMPGAFPSPEPTWVATPPGMEGVAPAGVITLAQRVNQLERQFASLEPRLVAIERALGIEPAARASTLASSALPPMASSTVATQTAQPSASPPVPVSPAEAPEFAFARRSDGTRSFEATGEGSPTFEPRFDATHAEPHAEPSGAGTPPIVPPILVEPPMPNPIWAWITGGNPFARIGVVLLFIGVGLLLKYTVDQVYVPISVRVAAVALGGVALLVFGWRLRGSHTAYAMALQGGGVGVLYLTVFGALRLYSMLPPIVAFALLFWIAATFSWLAIRQDAIVLAALAVAGGFLAPILTSSNTGSHVMLFAYYALLNGGIFGIAWFKAWRSLNLLGFAFTFVIGTLWGVTKYRPENFATTEPFLVLFFLFYVGIAVLYALRRSVEVKSYVDGALVFGTPLVAAGLQSALVHDIEYAMAWSALAMSALYLVLTRMLWARRGEGLRLLVETFLALGVLFATLAIPLALDARWTSAVWALEGAAAVWVGLRQQRRAVRAFGVLLQLGAGIAFLQGISLWTWAAVPKPAGIPILNSAYMGSVFVSLAGLYTAWLYQRRRDDATGTERGLIPFVFAWGVLWWLFAGWREISYWLVPEARFAAIIGLLTLTAVVFALLETRLRWPMARVPALGLLPVLLLIAIETTAQRWVGARHLFANWGWLAWPVAVAAVIWMLHRLDRPGGRFDEPDDRDKWTAVRVDYFHAGLLWLVLLLVAHELAWVGSRVGLADGAWAVVPWGLVPAVGLAAVCALASGASWPIGVHRSAYLALGGVPVIVVLILWTLVANVASDGNPSPLPYMPILNPVDLTQALVFVAAATWIVHVRRERPELLDRLPAHVVPVVYAALAFYWINLMVLRAIHFWFDVPYTPYGLWRSTLVQAALSLLWSMLALATMIFANRRKVRAPWIAGAALLGIVIAKLFVVELSQAGTIARIVSFIGVGVLVLVIGYFAPVPQQRPENVA